MSDELPDETNKMWEIIHNISNALAKVETSLENVSTLVSSLAHSVSKKGQINWTMAGVVISGLALVWTVFAFGLGTIGFMAVESVKSSTYRNESSISRLLVSEHENEKEVTRNSERIKSLERELYGHPNQED